MIETTETTNTTKTTETDLELATKSRLAGFAALFSMAFWRDWFVRPCGGREVLWLAAPIVVSSGSIAIMNFADRVFLTWWDKDAMSASFTSGFLFFGLTAFPFGIATFVNAFVAQYFGAKQDRRVGPIVWQGVFVGAVFGPLFILATPLVEQIFVAFKHSPEIVRFETVYWFYFSLSAPALIANESLAAFFSGRREMKTVMVAGLIAVFLNVVLDYLLIFGVRGYCAWGIAGAAIATSISIWAKFFILLAKMLKVDREGRYNVRGGFRFDRSEFSRLFRFGARSSAQTTGENWCYTLFILLIGVCGETASAATAIAFNLDFLAFMPIVGIGVAVTTLVGNQVGAGVPDLAVRATKTSVALAAPIIGVLTLAFLVAPGFFLDFYAMKNPAEFEPIRETATRVLRFVSVYLLADALNVIFASALRGAGDANFIMKTTLAVFVPIVIAAFVGVFGFGRGVYWCWSLMTLYIVSAGTLFAVRFYRGAWRNATLVELDLLDEPQSTETPTAQDLNAEPKRDSAAPSV